MMAIRIKLVNKYSEKVHLGMQNQKLSSVKPSVVDNNTAEYVELQTKVAAFTTKVQWLNA